jgi:hypothetical protein
VLLETILEVAETVLQLTVLVGRNRLDVRERSFVEAPREILQMDPEHAHSVEAPGYLANSLLKALQVLLV